MCVSACLCAPQNYSFCIILLYCSIFFSFCKILCCVCVSVSLYDSLDDTGVDDRRKDTAESLDTSHAGKLQPSLIEVSHPAGGEYDQHCCCYASHPPSPPPAACKTDKAAFTALSVFTLSSCSQSLCNF